MRAKTLFKVIEGGLRAPAREEFRSAVSEVFEEGRRRLNAAGVDRFEARERVTGLPMPSEVRHYKLQTEFTMSALARLDPVPPDFSDDAYWPKLEERAAG